MQNRTAMFQNENKKEEILKIPIHRHGKPYAEKKAQTKNEEKNAGIRSQQLQYEGR